MKHGKIDIGIGFRKILSISPQDGSQELAVSQGCSLFLSYACQVADAVPAQSL